MGLRNDSEKQLFASRSTWAFRGLLSPTCHPGGTPVSGCTLLLFWSGGVHPGGLQFVKFHVVFGCMPAFCRLTGWHTCGAVRLRVGHACVPGDILLVRFPDALPNFLQSAA